MKFQGFPHQRGRLFSHLYESEYDAVVEVLCGARVSVHQAVLAAKEHYIDSLNRFRRCMRGVRDGDPGRAESPGPLARRISPSHG